MNAFQVVEKMRKLSDEADALARVVHYFGDERDWSDVVYVLSDLQAEVERERDSLADKLRAMQL